MDAFERAIPVPQHEIEMRGALGRQIFRQRLPLAARGEHVEDRVENLAHIDRTLASAAPRGRDQRRYQRPLGVDEIGGITKAAAIGGNAVFGLPHLALLKESCAKQGITTDSLDSTSSWIGSKKFRRVARRLLRKSACAVCVIARSLWRLRIFRPAQAAVILLRDTFRSTDALQSITMKILEYNRFYKTNTVL
jgi:hypothetical protein